jgi:hypothetical protein
MARLRMPLSVLCAVGVGFGLRGSGDSEVQNPALGDLGMEQQNIPPSVPKDATKASEEQRVLQEQLDHRNDDPDAPGGHQDRHQIADET